MNTNELAKRFELFETICSSFPFSCRSMKLDKVLQALPHIHFDKGYVLEGRNTGFGKLGGFSIVYARKRFRLWPSSKTLDKLSNFSMYKDKELNDNLKDLISTSHLKVEWTPEGIWEFFLFKEMSCFLPLWWHANCLRFTMITDSATLFQKVKISDKVYNEPEDPDKEKDSSYPKDFKRYGKLSSNDLDYAVKLSEEGSILPSASINGNTSEVVYSYWSEWSGLSRVKLTYEIIDGNIHLIHNESENLIEYHCGVIY